MLRTPSEVKTAPPFALRLSRGALRHRRAFALHTGEYCRVEPDCVGATSRQQKRRTNTVAGPLLLWHPKVSTSQRSASSQIGPSSFGSPLADAHDSTRGRPTSKHSRGVAD